MRVSARVCVCVCAGLQGCAIIGLTLIFLSVPLSGRANLVDRLLRIESDRCFTCPFEAVMLTLCVDSGILCALLALIPQVCRSFVGVLVCPLTRDVRDKHTWSRVAVLCIFS